MMSAKELEKWIEKQAAIDEVKYAPLAQKQAAEIHERKEWIASQKEVEKQQEKEMELE